MQQTPLSRLVEVTLGLNLREHVITQRQAGASWQTIARDLTFRSGVVVTDESLRRWFIDEPDAERAETRRDAGAAQPTWLGVVAVTADAHERGIARLAEREGRRD